jgi:dipeptidyl aminopeptidase/acylaminoacyl peptidase
VGLVVLLLILALGGTGIMERLFYVPTRGPTPVPPYPPGGTIVRFASADGTPLCGWFFPALGADPAEAPTVLHVHGNAGNMDVHLGFTEFLPAAGFNLFLFDFRGYGESGGRAARRGPLIEDTQAALDILLARDDVDPRRIGVFGQSLGAAIATNVMAERPEIRAGVLVSGFTSWREMAADAVGGGSAGPVARLLARWLIRDDHRPLDAVATIDRPLLFAHGDADRIVPPAHAQRLADAAPRAELVILRGGDHNGIRMTHPGLDDRIAEFLHDVVQITNSPRLAGSIVIHASPAHATAASAQRQARIRA